MNLFNKEGDFLTIPEIYKVIELKRNNHEWTKAMDLLRLLTKDRLSNRREPFYIHSKLIS